MKTILPLLFFGVVAGSCLVGAAGKLPALGELGATHRRRAAWQVGWSMSGSTLASTGFVPCPMSRRGIASTPRSAWS
jgi:hypothetical protein